MHFGLLAIGIYSAAICKEGLLRGAPKILDSLEYWEVEKAKESKAELGLFDSPLTAKEANIDQRAIGYLF